MRPKWEYTTPGDRRFTSRELPGGITLETEFVGYPETHAAYLNGDMVSENHRDLEAAQVAAEQRARELLREALRELGED